MTEEIPIILDKFPKTKQWGRFYEQWHDMAIAAIRWHRTIFFVIETIKRFMIYDWYLVMINVFWPLPKMQKNYSIIIIKINLSLIWYEPRYHLWNRYNILKWYPITIYKLLSAYLDDVILKASFSNRSIETKFLGITSWHLRIEKKQSSG